MSNCRRIFFRADAGPEIGYGHFIRTLALADMLKADFDCVFFTRTPTDYQKREAAAVCPLIALPDDKSHFNVFLEKLTGQEIVVLDNYFFSTDYQREIKAKGCQLVCIDDMHDKHYVADIVINHGCADVSVFDVEPYTRLCLGIEYALLRKPFLEACTAKMREQGHVVIAFGGSDSKNLTTKYAQILCKDDSVSKITAIVGDAFQFSNELKEIPKVQILHNLTAQQMAKLFCNVQYAVLSSSTICIEAIACHCPVYAGWYVENQKELYDYLVSEDMIFDLGYLSQLSSLNLISQVNEPKRISSIKKNQAINAFYNLTLNDFGSSSYCFTNFLNLSESEHRIVHSIRNETSIRTCMVNMDSFSFDSHLIFVDSLKKKDSVRYWAVKFENKIIGSISLHPIEWQNKSAEWGIYISSIYQGKGHATKMSKIFFNYLKNSTHIGSVVANIKVTNQKSLEFHQRIGFEMVNKQNDYYCLIKYV